MSLQLRLFVPVALAALAAVLAGCLPYAVGTTAQPVAQGEVTPTSSVYFIPGGFDLVDERSGGSYTAFDLEARYGIDDASDFGVRIPGASGVVLSYKRRLTTRPAPAAGLAVIGGLGVVNVGEHAYGDVTLVASARQRTTLTPYGGVRAFHVLPLTSSAVTDTPTLGAYAGVRIGRLDLGISPEVAVYYDEPALGLRDRSWIVVPSFTVHGRDLMRLLFGGR